MASKWLQAREKKLTCVLTGWQGNASFVNLSQRAINLKHSIEKRSTMH